ncbi:MAG: alpha-amylase family glycosyl hydrolase [Gemmatimonadales bacterium]
MVEQRLSDLDLLALRTRRFFPSPSAWEDQVLYFLLVDRFSDGNEQGYRDVRGNVVAGGSTLPYRDADRNNATRSEPDSARWRDAGTRFVGGTLKGLATKIGYLKRLGVTAVWLSPVFKQVPSQETYHGYGIQHFLDVDPRFGTREDLCALVTAAHEQGIYVVLDIVFNHSGDVFEYAADRYPAGAGGAMDPRWDDRPYEVRGYRDKRGSPTIPFGPVDLAAHADAFPDGAIWPAELQAEETFTRKGRIDNWDFDPEYTEGDFFSLKDIHHGRGSLDRYAPSAALRAICEVYKFWIAFADVDGFRIDTVKHLDRGATRFFASVIKEFAQGIGKENFYLIGEITGGRSNAFLTLELTGLDAALGIDDIPDKMEYLAKGLRNPADYFDLFRNSALLNKESHTWLRNRVVTMFDDHDQVRKGESKARFCADPEAPSVVLNVLALNLTTLGIPCIYYGSEQRFDGHGGSDRYIREAMFGGEFGAFGSRGRHGFDEDGPVYRELGKIVGLRRNRLALRRGRQYLREISGDGHTFGLPRMLGGQIRSVVPWSRIFDDHELLVAINTDYHHPTTAWVTIDNDLHPAGGALRCVYSSDAAQIGSEVEVEARNGKAVRLTVPAAGCTIWE